MKKILLALVMVSSASAAYASDFNLETIKAADLGLKTEAVEVPAPAAPARDAAQDQLARYQQVVNELNAVRNDLTWVGSDLDGMESRVRRAIQFNGPDLFIQSDIRRMSMDMSRRFDNMRRAAMDVRGLLGSAVKSAELNNAARDMNSAAREILGQTWPMLENSAQRLESTIRSGRPEIVGYDSAWAATDISRFSRQLSDQARNASFDTQSLVSKTQP